MTKNDKRIEEILKKVDEQKKALGVKPKLQLVTNGVLSINMTTCNINVATIPQLIAAYAALLRIEQDVSLTHAAANALGVEVPETLVCGYTTDQWMSDITDRVELVKWILRKMELEKTEATLKQMISEDAKTNSALADIEKQFK